MPAGIGCGSFRRRPRKVHGASESSTARKRKFFLRGAIVCAAQHLVPRQPVVQLHLRGGRGAGEIAANLLLVRKACRRDDRGRVGVPRPQVVVVHLRQARRRFQLRHTASHAPHSGSRCTRSRTRCATRCCRPALPRAGSRRPACRTCHRSRSPPPTSGRTPTLGGTTLPRPAVARRTGSRPPRQRACRRRGRSRSSSPLPTHGPDRCNLQPPRTGG